MRATSVAQASSKTAEFARLFDVMNRVATRRARALTGSTSTDQVISADDIANVPAEFAPVLKNLSTVLSLRAVRDEEHSRRRTEATSMNTHACHGIKLHGPSGMPPATLSAEDQTPHDIDAPAAPFEDNLERTSFPLEERYPFTFKLMLHKLYNLDEWAEKVERAVETSKAQFRPLAERVPNVVRNITATIKEKGPVGKKSGVRPVLGHRGTAKPRSYSQTYAYVSPAKLETSRTLKKRCVGRRKSISGPMSLGVWVYDAAVSATEVVGPRSAVDIACSRSRDADGMMENRGRHRSLTALEEIQSRDAARRQVNNPVPFPEMEVIITPERSPAPSMRSVRKVAGRKRRVG